jgi:hypothetical protein
LLRTLAKAKGSLPIIFFTLSRKTTRTLWESIIFEAKWMMGVIMVIKTSGTREPTETISKKRRCVNNGGVKKRQNNVMFLLNPA